MCVIFQQEIGFTLPYEMLFNAAHNNPHGYGVVIRDGNKIQAHRKLSEKGNDPEEIYRLLKDNEDAERWVHVRNRTQGEVSEANVQPFCVYNSAKKQIYFMHNGTMNGVHYPDSQLKLLDAADADKDASDSRKFAYFKLQPLLTRLLGENGSADLEDPFVREVLDKFWPYTNNRGVLISNDQAPYVLSRSSWDQVKCRVEGTETDITFLASNNDYFEKLKRGPLYEQRRADEEKKRREALSSMGKGGTKAPVGELTLLSSTPFSKRYGISEKVSDVLNDWNMYSPEGYIALGNMTYDEIRCLFNSSLTDATLLFMQLTSFLAEATKENLELKEEKDRATKMIATLKNRKKRSKDSDEVELAEIQVNETCQLELDQ